ncbi:uncharacterized protein LOC133201481 [Saccostrea echinata]|uniref:uncharacterized protein LOC133201481 n=1 Tax=Saccostrea echinata TaxID=191078 RepID=UPI002A814E2A|nr:uncharacterized protein LOC133201481 [Saccostrea echinata]
MILVFIFSILVAATKGFDADAIVQAACAASATNSHFVSAIRKPCGTGPSCNTICQNAISSMRAIYGNQGSATGSCFQTFHFYYKYSPLTPEQTGSAQFAMYRYGNGCGSTGCGPNFCCCQA